MVKKRQGTGNGGAPPVPGGDTPPAKPDLITTTIPKTKTKPRTKVQEKAQAKDKAEATVAKAPRVQKSKKPASKHAAARAKRRPPMPPPAAISIQDRKRDAGLAEKVKTLAGQGTIPENAARYLAMTTDELLRIYGDDWADGLAMGEIKVDQAVFERATGRAARYDANRNVTNTEIKPDPAVAMFLRKRLDAQRHREKLLKTLDWAKVHPDERPEGHKDPGPGKPRGRGTPKFGGKFTKAVAAEIVTRLLQGEYLVSICNDPRMPSYPTVITWAASPEVYPNFAIDYACAREAQIEALIQGGQAILESPEVEVSITTTIGPDGETVQVKRERGVAHARALAEYRLKAAGMLNDARLRTKMALARLDKEFGQGDDEAVDGDDEAIEGSWIVMKDGGSPDR